MWESNFTAHSPRHRRDAAAWAERLGDGLTVAAVLKYADAVLKGYATAISVLLTGVLSMVLFGTELSVEYALGMTNVLAAVFLYLSLIHI